nr:zinc finger BED domain-containing protein 1-like [Onthophagus taurus]
MTQYSSHHQIEINKYFADINTFLNTGAKAAKITNAIIFMICKDCQPISVVDNDGFKQVLRITAPHYTIPHRSTITRMIDSKYEVLSKVIKEELANVKNITLATDVWTNTMQARSFLGITVHYVKDISLNSIVLCVQQLEERHTGEYLSKILTDTCENWGIHKEHVTAVVTDDAANMILAVELAFTKAKHMNCFAHTLNLVAEKSVKSVAKFVHVLNKVKQIVTWFKHSVIAIDDLRKMSQNTKLIQECPTRWNSKFCMIERFLQLHKEVNEILIRHTSAPPMVSALEILQLKETMEILRPLESTSTECCGEKYLTSSMVIPMVHCMVKRFPH